MRLARYLALAGVASRRRCEELIRAGRVRVQGRQETDPSRRVQVGQETVELDGQPLALQPRVYVLLHKPPGLLSAARDDRGRTTVTQYVQSRGGPDVRLYPVGRLDRMSEGLMLLTNDGELAHALTHPSREVPKTYRVWVDGAVSPATVGRLRSGVMLDDGPARAVAARIVRTTGRGTVLELTLHEGRKREVRRMCLAVGHPVRRLVRVRLGPLTLRGLPTGAWRYLTPQEVQALYREAGLDPGG